MKKIIFLFLLLACWITGSAQEDFESGVPPTGWIKTNGANGLGTGFTWQANPTGITPYQGNVSAYINNENIGSGNTEEDWLISPQLVIPVDGQLRFYVRQFQIGDINTKFRVMVSTDPTQNNLAAFSVAQSWTEAELNDFDDGDVTDFDLRTVNFNPSLYGQTVYIAFVREYTQPTPARTGERFLIDQVNLVQICGQPQNLTVSGTTCDSTTLGWTAPAGVTTYQVVIVPEGNPINETLAQTATGNTYNYSGLLPGTTYSAYVRSFCAADNTSAWLGPLNFTTIAAGSLCNCPIQITACPAQFSGNTQDYGDDFDTIQSPAAGSLCGAVPATTNYMAGPEVVYSYTATSNGTINLWMDPVQNNSGIFVYSSCANIGVNCIAGAANSNSTPRTFNFDVTAGTTYYIVISSTAAVTNVAYDLVLQCVSCATTTPISGGTAGAITSNSAQLSWAAGATAGGAYTSWNVVTQPASSPVPTGGGVVANTNTNFPVSGLTGGVAYEFWVQGICPDGSGNTSIWYGPFPFTTPLCNDADKCTYTFRMTDSANNGWNGARMQIIQNNAVLATIGSTYNAGAGPVDVAVQLCPGQPFSVFWNTAGTQPQQCILTILNSAGQAIFLKPAGVSGVNQTVYSGVTSATCSATTCDTFPLNLTVSNITTNGAQINWSAPGTDTWDIFVGPGGGPAPDDATVPTYDDITSNPFTTIVPLTPDTPYQVCVRVQCDFTTPDWVCTNFTTVPTCPKPTGLTVNTPTLNSIKVNWTPGTGTDTNWEILLIPGCATPPAAPGVNPTEGTVYPVNIADVTGTPPGPYSYTVTGLTQATIYYVYIRTVCPADDKSTWTGPVNINTTTCDAADKCNYRFLLTDTGANGWGATRLQVRQNCIVVATLNLANGAGPTSVSVALCDDIPFDVFWSIAGANPEEVGFSVVNPYNDIVYTYQPGTGTPLTSVYSAIAECDPPACPKPTNLVASTTTPPTQTTATISWTENGTATQWEVYAVPVGSALPVNGSPVTGVFPYFIANTNTDFQLTGLTPGTAYLFYVRAICSPTSTSTWTIPINVAPIVPGPGTFITKPVNDECVNAIPVTVNPDWNCNPSLNATGSTLGATSSGPILTGVDCGTSNDDVWFSFVATSNIHTIDLLNVVGTPAAASNINHNVFSGSCDGTLTNLYCSGENTSVATGLTVGNTYYIRVYTLAASGGSASFNVCVGTPPPPGTNDECSNAIPLVVNETGQCFQTVQGNLIGATASTGAANSCNGTEDDDVWFSFVAEQTTQIIDLLNIQGTTANLNFAVYSGSCGSLTLKQCANGLTNLNTTYVVNQTYYVRVWSVGSTPQVVTFDVCVKGISTCENAVTLCAKPVTAPDVYDNSTGLPSPGQIACLFTAPNPTYHILKIDGTGTLVFTIHQNTQIDYETGAETGTPLDVDFVAWGPFTDTESCDQIVFGPCNPPCPNNTTNPDFYPAGNVVDCSYSGAPVESLTIENAQPGQYYVVLVTNFANTAGQISIAQTNISDPDAATTSCCGVNLGDDISVCGQPSVELSALVGIAPEFTPVEFEWSYNDGTPIPGATSSTFTATQSGTYKVRGRCGFTFEEDTIVVTLGPAVEADTPADVVICDDISRDGLGSFDLTAITPAVLGDLNPADYVVTYHIDSALAGGDTGAIDTSIPFDTTTQWSQTVYIRVESVVLSTCYAVVPVNLVVNPLPDPAFSYGSASYCQDGTPATVLPTVTGTAGLFSATPDGLVIDAATGEIDIMGSTPQAYTVKNFIVGVDGCIDVEATFDVTITPKPVAAFTYPQTNYCTSASPISPVLTGTAGQFSATPAGLDIDPSTGVITFATSAEGTYEIINTIAASGECDEVVSDPVTITVSLEQIADFTYDSNQYCKTEADPSPIFTTGAAGLFTSTPAGLVIDAATGTIDLSASAPGPYTVTNTRAASGGCLEDVATFNLTIYEQFGAVFSYPSTSYCTDGGQLTPSLATGTVAGTFTATPAGLSINAATGAIDLANSDAGVYLITNTITNNGPCSGDSQQFTLTVTEAYTGTISYSSSSYCSDAGAQLPTNTAPAGGVYSASGGLTINAATGEINPSASSGGLYTIYYTLPANGACSAFQASTPVTIIPSFGVMVTHGCEDGAYRFHAEPVNNSFDPATATYSWTGPGVQPTTDPAVIIATVGGTYQVTVTTADGCTETASESELIIACGIQRGISPNGDGKNDTFDLSGYNVKKLTIFNRYGTQVYEYLNYTNQWDGHSAGGETLPSATYFYVIETAEGDQLTGWIYINR
ncbi:MULTISPECIES: fibronectin type III domain-containing protein [unclassified Flavobacterium]|uniref:fibronectin type III domain-containing protein n=1 Tax=unclassified Flavobacterium TaxID=196869 RepID=UPI001F13BE22|nr:MULTISPECIES: fibronectin type III domain-containing protein [unclassified Flavobacterium]UMY66270.1 fibronectin type III domain-containing protein [Flavobacterium sp. HJ-32-4]